MIQQEQKEQFVKEIKEDIAKAEGVVFLDYTGLTVAEVESIRKKARAADIKYKVVKNTLMARALIGTEAEEASKFLKGSPTGVIVGFSDPVVTAKLAVDFTKDSKHVRIKGGILDKKAISSNQTEALAQMPSKREMVTQIVGMALGPARNLLAQIKSPAGRIVGAVEKKAKEEEPTA
ncbi:MAG: 50S ribosomal protein L10 [Deltaproteobacteria bacterium]|nr:50S ribosomal protein L10 [Deltaproteobacteria bacterium]